MHIKCVIGILGALICSHLSLPYRGKPEKNTSGSESVLDPGGHLLLRWRVDYRLGKVSFSLHLSENAPGFNWLALGFSDRGELAEADMCLLWIDYKGIAHFEDTHADSEGYLHRDEQQNCDAFSLHPDSRVIAFDRLFDTCDDDDYVIEDGTTHVVWARGVDTLFSSEGLQPTSAAARDRGYIRVRLLAPPPLATPRADTIRITNRELKVPSADTTYWCHIQKLPDYVAERVHHIVQFESTIQSGNEGLVHHMEVFHCDAGPDVEIPHYEGSCFSPDRPNITKTCSKVKAAWAMGAPPFTYPEEAGLPLGGATANRYVMLEVHYNNPELRSDWVDSSGIVMHVTSQLRRFDAAIMELGLEYIDKMAIPAGQKAFPLTGYCIPECTSVGVPPPGIVVFGSQLHTHLTGVMVRTRHFRNGVELPVLNQDRHYSTHFQEIRILRAPVNVRPGDLLETSCVYDTSARTNATVGGHAITDEMCVNYIHYYPASQLEVCKSSVSTRALDRYFAFENRWDEMNTSVSKSPRQNYLAVSPWSPLRVQALRELYRLSPISMQCNKSDGSRFQGDWEERPIPAVRVPLTGTPRLCPSVHLTKLQNSINV